MSDRLIVTSVSGGKDSTATALLALDQAGEHHFVFCDTGNEHDLTYEYVYEYLPKIFGEIVTLRADFTQAILRKRRYIETKWEGKGVPREAIERALRVLHPTGNPYLDLCLMKGMFPSRKKQFCTQELKRIPLDNYTLELLGPGRVVESWRGIRKDESQNRADSVGRELSAEGWWIVHPIVDWTSADVVSFVHLRGAKLNPLYSLGMSRVGCMPCINVNKGELSEIARRFPQHIDKIREWEHLVGEAGKRGWTTFFTDSKGDDETDAELYERLRVDTRVLWSKTSHGGRQFTFDKIGQPPPCSSVYGLCEPVESDDELPPSDMPTLEMAIGAQARIA
jgi:3'-phosphoadenosine 5'-phosphosulfate sulfotransferase (PAPS reductase)/FAD synthetase